jgi:hypothetical protein
VVISVEGILVKNNRILFYGNTAGYIEKDRAVVDTMFKCDELQSFLTDKQKLKVQWTNGVFDRLANGESGMDGNTQILKNCRIHQLKSDVDILIKFISYDEMVHQFGEPNTKNYNVVYDGQLETNSLEAIYEKFNTDHPTGFQGHSLSMSDIVELYDQNGSTFHYVDRIGFKQIDFNQTSQGQANTQSINI